MSDLCEHCGHELRGLAMVGDALVCHPIDPYPDCYRLVTVYGEKLGSRNVRRLRAAVDAALALAADFDADAQRFHDKFAGYPEQSAYQGGRADSYEDASERLRVALAPVADPDPHTTSDEETTT